MKLVNNCISPLPFYDDVAQQNHRKDYAFGHVYQLATYKNMLLPFQAVTQNIFSIDKVLLTLADNSKVTDITQSLKENGLTYTNYEGFAVLKYPGVLPVVDIKYEGLYYLEVQLKFLEDKAVTKNLYSEVFTIINRLDDYLLIEYSNPYSFPLKGGLIDFSDNFKFRCYLKAQVGKPEYVFEEEVSNRMGYQFIESQVSKKVYKFTAIAPEYLCDALRIVRLCENKRIVSKGQEYELTSFGMDVEWQEQGDLAAIECEFETDTVIANIGGYKPEPLGGDFNESFNNDFNIE